MCLHCRQVAGISGVFSALADTGPACKEGMERVALLCSEVGVSGCRGVALSHERRHLHVKVIAICAARAAAPAATALASELGIETDEIGVAEFALHGL